MPRRPNERVKTDRRDAQTLVRLLRAGELAAVWVPDEAHEAIREVVGARRQVKQEIVSAKNTLKSFLPRHDRRFPGKAVWSKLHWRRLPDQRFAFPHQQYVYEEYKQRIQELQARCERLEQVLEEAVANWPLAPIVTTLQALRGIKFIAAVTLVAEIGDLHRFDSAKQLMAWLGLVPAEHSSGTRTRRGELTRTGNPRPCHADRIRMALPLPGKGRTCAAGTQRSIARSHPGNRLEGADTSMHEVPPSGGNASRARANRA